MHTTTNTDLWSDLAWAFGSIGLIVIVLVSVTRGIGWRRLLMLSVAVSAADEVYKQTKKGNPDLGNAALQGAAFGIALWLALLLALPIALYWFAYRPFLMRGDDASRTLCCIGGVGVPQAAYFGEHAAWMLSESYDHGHVYQLANLDAGHFVLWPVDGEWNARFAVSAARFENLLQAEVRRNGPRTSRDEDDLRSRAYSNRLPWIAKYLPIEEAGAANLPEQTDRRIRSIRYLALATAPPSGYTHRNVADKGELDLSEYDPDFATVTRSGTRRVIRAGKEAICVKVAPGKPMAAIVYPYKKRPGFLEAVFGRNPGQVRIVNLDNGETVGSFSIAGLSGSSCSDAYGLEASDDGLRWIYVRGGLVKVFDVRVRSRPAKTADG